MNAAALWQRYQDWLYYHEGLGFYLDISRMRFDDAFVASDGAEVCQSLCRHGRVRSRGHRQSR
jgi:hypothetical protein